MSPLGTYSYTRDWNEPSGGYGMAWDGMWSYHQRIQRCIKGFRPKRTSKHARAKR